MGVRRVVTGEVEGRSTILTDGPPPSSAIWENLWITGAGDPLGHDPVEAGDLEPPPGGLRWRLFSVPPDKALRQMIAEHAGDGLEVGDEAFFHQTRTVDFVYVLDGGDLTLELEEGEVLLHPGDCVVQRGTNHAWRNRNDVPVRLLVVMSSLP
ncbi:cupin domain-containing protein [Frankia gtarii]|uniref:cupin domain-containing protein n=1 Tax=Frankia gtarii TaxID=2950102 RepID=UPI0021C188BF|nr:cupin domain-containing protein [Frankia gtarii]